MLEKRVKSKEEEKKNKMDKNQTNWIDVAQ